MLRIRLRRTGKAHQPSYRVIVADQHAKRDGEFVEILGHYEPRSKDKTLVLNTERVRHWLERGAQPSETLHRLLFREGLTTIEPPKRQTVPSKVEQAAARAAAAAAAQAIADAAAKATADAAARAAEAAAAEATTPAEA